MILALLMPLTGLPATAQEPAVDYITIQAETAEMAAPEFGEIVDLDEIPPLTDEKAAQMAEALEKTNLSATLPDAAGAVEPAGPMADTEAILVNDRERSGEPLAPGSAMIYRWKDFGSSIPSGYKSNVMESSVDGKASRLFYTGNWFAARSTNKGLNWTFIDPYADYPDFCCDQVVAHDKSRNIFLWLRMAVPDGNGVNTFKLSVDFNDPFVGNYWTYTAAPTNTNPGWTNQWWDYPAMALGADYVYIAWNMFDYYGYWTRTVMLRWPLDEIAAGVGFSYNYAYTSDWFTFKPIKGADHTMYWASNWPMSGGYYNTRLGIWRWPEYSGSSISFWDKTIPAYTLTGRGDAVCGNPNWAARYDQRVLAGARYVFDSTNFNYPGDNILAWWWNVQEGGGFSYPYIEGAAFWEDTMGLVGGTQGRPYVYGSYCFAYPDVAPNIRGDLGLIFNYATSPDWHKPNVGYSLADDYRPTPPGWLFYGAAGSNAGPSDQKWGDYNTTYAFNDRTPWIAAAHFIPGYSNCSSCSTPLFFSYGRERDIFDWAYW